VVSPGRRFKGPDVATNVTKNAPEYCSVYVISKGKILSVRSATRSAPKIPNRNPLHSQPVSSVVSSNNAHAMYASPGGLTRGTYLILFPFHFSLVTVFDISNLNQMDDMLHFEQERNHHLQPAGTMRNQT